MQNEVYGQVILDISVPTDENNETIALMKENFRLSPYRIVKPELSFEDVNGIVHTVKIHNWDILLDRFFGEGE
jgi:hypothetical protein